MRNKKTDEAGFYNHYLTNKYRWKIGILLDVYRAVRHMYGDVPAIRLARALPGPAAACGCDGVVGTVQLCACYWNGKWAAVVGYPG